MMTGEGDVYVVEEEITFLVPMRKTDEPKAEWKFPPLPILRSLFDHIRSSIVHLDIFSTLVSCGVDPATQVATIILNTKNYTVFQLVRKRIRDFNGIEGIAFDTYEKAAFVARHGVTIYVPSQYKQMPLQLIIGVIQKNHPQLNHPYKILEKSIFTSEGPGFKGGRSRIGDQIVLIEGSQPFMDALSKFPSRFPFEVSKTWRLTIRGGRRSDQQRSSGDKDDMNAFSEQFRNSVLVGAAGDMMEEAKRSYGGRPL